MAAFRKHLSIPGLLATVRADFETIPDHRTKRVNISLPDTLMSALAMFLLKYSSLLKFDEERNEDIIRHNLKSLYKVKFAPCDTQMRTIADPVDPNLLRQPFVSIFNHLQIGGVLKEYEYFDDYYVVTVDATGQYSSNVDGCAECCVKTHGNGETSYYHQLLAAVLVHPDKKTVIPFAPEAIIKEKNASKNDCEINAAKRLLPKIKKEHPRLKILAVFDALYGNAPFVKLLIILGFSYIIGVKSSDHEYLFDCVNEKIAKREHKKLNIYEEKTKITREFLFVNALPLNKSNQDVIVNFLEYREVDENGKCLCYFTWITNIELTEDNVFYVMKAGRARWKIENEVFNTLKNLGYNFEHNYGHGKQHLATVFAMLMMLAFLIDQTQECCCRLFQQAKDKFRTKAYLWLKMQSLFLSYFIKDWDSFYLAIIHKHKPSTLEPDTDTKYYDTS
jgi:hypothetical protein